MAISQLTYVNILQPFLMRNFLKSDQFQIKIAKLALLFWIDWAHFWKVVKVNILIQKHKKGLIFQFCHNADQLFSL